MGTSARAVVTDGRGGFTIDDVVVGDPGPAEVLVDLHASGVCHTDHDLLAVPVPLVLGHEGAGTVAAVGDGVTRIAPGDRVLLNWAMPCGSCFQCVEGNQHLCERGSPLMNRAVARRGRTTRNGEAVLRAFGLGTMSTTTLVPVEAVVPITTEISYAAACIVGCGVMTGFGSAVNAARVRPGTSVVVIGCGGVGLHVIQGARISGASRIVAVDLQPTKLDLAIRCGATDVIQPDAADDDLNGVATQVRAMTSGRGADYAFECTAVPALGAAPLAMVRHGGTAVQVSGIEQPISIDMRLFEWDKTYLNPLYGMCRPSRDFPRIFDLHARGLLLLDELVTATYALEDAASAFADLAAGRNAKSVLLIA
jgi:S-(hydroxymethyl)glutathione dehydrogenase/alcohol dehydrogenase